MRWIWLVVVLLFGQRASAQPADCRPPPTVGSMPLQLNIGGQPGVPSGASGELYLQVPIPDSEGLACDDEGPPPADVLRGAPARDLLDGPGLTKAPVNILRGSGG